MTTCKTQLVAWGQQGPLPQGYDASGKDMKELTGGEGEFKADKKCVQKAQNLEIIGNNMV